MVCTHWGGGTSSEVKNASLVSVQAKKASSVLHRTQGTTLLSVKFDFNWILYNNSMNCFMYLRIPARLSAQVI